MKKWLPYASLIFLGLSILIGSSIVASALNQTEEHNAEVSGNQSEMQESYRYEMFSANDSNLIVFDKETGMYYRKYIPNTEGPTEWTLEINPFESDSSGTSRSY
ncbi:hypothetical protein LCM20_06515 [Halobacillus litoralis]|uniref:hypothetical protein n=1 Tax=Halobacillus litoralis TaxID=45668 RepID=UPI001CD51F82|nr:hypothetical protein [Halobacillus litoralis]MCA0970234.1 hypothetical protein [Halobacillus litoralis]